MGREERGDRRGPAGRDRRAATGESAVSYETTVRPSAWSPKGEAVARAVGKRSLHVWSGIPGEQARVKVVHEGQNQDTALWLRGDPAHPTRVAPPCEKYDTCGGCALMHLNPSGQEAARRELVSEALAGAGLGQVALGDWFASPDGFQDFRYVIKLGVGWSDAGHLRVGAWGRRGRHLVPIPQCNVTAPVLRKAMKAVAHHIIDKGIEPYDPENDRGVLRTVVLRASRETGEVLVTFVAGRHVHELSELAEEIASQATEIVGVWLHLNTEPGNAIFQAGEDGAYGFKPLIGKDHIEESLNGVTYPIGPGDFFQTNPAMAAVLYKRTIERLRPEKDVTFIDLYSGVGGIALQAAKISGWALGVEEVEGAVARARAAAHLNKITAEFRAQEVQWALEDLVPRFADTRPIVSVNPARKGLEPGVVEGILALKPRRIGYVSCNPEALARDLALFAKAGFFIGPVDMFDMFPNTPHVETLVVLESPDEVGVTRGAPKRRIVR